MAFRKDSQKARNKMLEAGSASSLEQQTKPAESLTGTQGSDRAPKRS